MIWLFVVTAVCYVMVFLEFTYRVELVLVDNKQPMWAVILRVIGVICLICGLTWANLRHYGFI